MTANYTVVIEREDDGRYSAYVPDLPGCTSMGQTRREAAGKHTRGHRLLSGGAAQVETSHPKAAGFVPDH